MDTQVLPIALKPVQAAEQLGVSRAQMYRLIAAGEVPSFKVGKQTRVLTEGLREWAAKRAGK